MESTSPTKSNKTNKTVSLLSRYVDISTPETKYSTELSFDSIIDKIGFGKFQLYLFFILGSFCLVDASQILLAPMIIPILESQQKLSSISQMFTGTSLFIGQVFGSYISGIIADKYGRRQPMIYATFFTFTTSIAQAFTVSVYDLIILRILLGVCLGFALPVGIPLLTEFCPTINRGKYLNFWQIFSAIGYLVDILIAWAQFTNLSVGNWRLYIIILSIFAFVSFILVVLFLNESARFLLLQNKSSEALQIINKVAYTNIKATNYLNEEQLKSLQKWSNQVQQGCSQATETKSKIAFYQKIKTLFLEPYQLITPILWFAWFSIYLSENGIHFLLPLTLVELQKNVKTQKHDEKAKEEFLQLIYAVISVVMSYICAGFIADIQRLGRKNSLIILGFLILISSLILQFNVWPGYITWISFQNFFINVNMSLLYEFTSEIYPTNFRATAMGLSCSFGNLGAIIMPFIGIYLKKFSTLTPYLLFGALPAVSSILFYFIPYDTKGHGIDFLTEMMSEKSRSEIEEFEMLDYPKSKFFKQSADLTQRKSAFTRTSDGSSDVDIEFQKILDV